jgi:hypothetical protein
MDAVHLVLERIQGQAFVDTVMNLGIPYKSRNFLAQ